MRRLRNSAPPARRTRVDVSPIRMALAAARRIRDVGFRLQRARPRESSEPPRSSRPLEGVLVDEGVGSKELTAREAVAGRQLPPSYVAVVRHVTALGEPEELFDAVAMSVHVAELRLHPSGTRYLPFARSEGKLLCFDLRGDSAKGEGELPVVAWNKGYGVPVARSFAEWLDALADRRQDQHATASNVPPRLKKLLTELGFEFLRGLAAELETADSDAVEALVGEEVVDQLLADGPLYDSTGKALLQLHLDDFSMRVRLREGFVEVLAEHVFPWLRTFRDEDFFAPLAGAEADDDDLENQVTQIQLPSHVRDLRRADPRPPPRQHGEVKLLSLGAQRHELLDATGSGQQDMHLLGRVQGSNRSLLLRVEGTRITAARYVDEPLSRVHLAEDGALWALGGSHAYRYHGLEQERFALARPTEGASHWLDIGGAGERPLVWGAGALLCFDGTRFAPFAPDLSLEPSETVLAVEANADRLAVLVAREGCAAVAHFDGVAWLPIAEESLVAGAPIDLRTFAGQNWMLDRHGALYTQSGNDAPRPVPFARTSPAFFESDGKARRLFEVQPGRSGLLLSSQGGFLFAPTVAEATFYRGQNERARGRLCRIGVSGATLALLGGAAWLHAGGAFHPLDLTQF